MFGRKKNSEAPTGREAVARRLQQTGLTVAGERGGRAANRVSEALGCGRIDLCSDPTCLDCAPTN
ncbi:hypothetical protein ACWD3J_14040 [Streptomyces sp. NPDC002755]